MSLMKARWPMKCACGCGETIYVGSQFVARSGKVFKPRHENASRGVKTF